MAPVSEPPLKTSRHLHKEKLMSASLAAANGFPIAAVVAADIFTFKEEPKDKQKKQNIHFHTSPKCPWRI